MANALETTEVEIRKVKQFKHNIFNMFVTFFGQFRNRLNKSYLKLNLDDRMTGDAMSTTIQEWHSNLLTKLKNISHTAEVTETTFQDARKLFGANFDTKVAMRKAETWKTHEEIVLVQFDPNFTSTDVICRHPSCKLRNPVAAKYGKRDLYLCPHHRQVLRKSISDTLAKKNVKIDTSEEKPEPGRFAGFTSLISLLEGAYHNARKFETLQIQEAILNVRNFLIITSTVLNPDDNNLAIVLPSVIQILQLLLEKADSLLPVVVSLVCVLREVTEIILFAFGVVYMWVSLAPEGPGAQIGAGVGGIIGAVGFALGPWSGAAGVAIGGMLGSLIGAGIYNLMVGDQRQQEVERFRRYWGAAGGGGHNGQPDNSYIVYYFDGNALGELYLQPFPAAQ